MNVSELLKRLEMERMQGNFALSNYPNDEYWVNWDELVNVFEEYAQPQLNENQMIKTNNNLLKINDLAFELQHDDELTKEQWDKVENIYKLSLMGDEEEE